MWQIIAKGAPGPFALAEGPFALKVEWTKVYINKWSINDI